MFHYYVEPYVSHQMQSSFSIIVIEFDEFNEFEIWWCHCKKVTNI